MRFKLQISIQIYDGGERDRDILRRSFRNFCRVPTRLLLDHKTIVVLAVLLMVSNIFNANHSYFKFIICEGLSIFPSAIQTSTEQFLQTS